MCAIAPAYGVQEVTLKELPPLQPLHWCKHSDGHVADQVEPCASDTTEVSSWTERQPDGTMRHLSVEEGRALEADNKLSPSDRAAKEAQKKEAKLRDFWYHAGKWTGFAVLVGLVAKFLKQSFVLWLFLGFVLRAVLVGMNVIAP
jgi:hypothetical protein